MKSNTLSLKKMILTAFMVISIISLSPLANANNPKITSTNITSSVITLQNWQQSTEREQYAFLVGMVSMLSLEKEWQHKNKPLPFKKTLIPSWVMGLQDVTFANMCETLNTYIKMHPNDLSRPVIDVLWYAYPQQKIDNAKIK